MTEHRCQVSASHEEPHQIARTGRRECPLRSGRRRGLPALRPVLETADRQGQSSLPPQPDSAVVPRASDHGHSAPGSAPLVHRPPCNPSRRESLSADPLGHPPPSGDLRSPTGGQQFVRRSAALPAIRTRTVPDRARGPPLGGGARFTGSLNAGACSGRPPASGYRLPPRRDPDAVLARLSRGPSVGLREIRAGLAEQVGERRLREERTELKAKGLIAPAGRGTRWTRL